jgi:hypothetical protein
MVTQRSDEHQPLIPPQSNSDIQTFHPFCFIMALYIEYSFFISLLSLFIHAIHYLLMGIILIIQLID